MIDSLNESIVAIVKNETQAHGTKYTQPHVLVKVDGLCTRLSPHEDPLCYQDYHLVIGCQWDDDIISI